jgi:transposase
LLAGGDALSQGRKEDPEPTLFIPTVDVYRHIPKTGFYEELDRLADWSFVYELTKPLYAAKMGRPSLDPVVFFKCMVIGFYENIVYDTELEYRIADSLSLRKFLGYGLEERTPDESTLRKTRQRMPVDAFDRVLAYVRELCQGHGLVRGRAVGTDSTSIDANASMDSLRHKEAGCTYEEFMLAMRRQDDADATKSEAMEADKKREGKASNRVWESTTDPESRVIQHSDGHTHLSYKVDTSVDLETGIILCAGAEPANVSDQTDFLERVDEVTETVSEMGLNVEVIVADKGHHSGENLAGMEQRSPVALISSPKTSRGKAGFRREDFVYDSERDELICPAGQVLSRLSRKDSTSRYYGARPKACRSCAHFGVCTKNKNGRNISISIHEDLILANRERVHSEAARPLMQIRRQRGEAPFGYFKMFGGLRRFAGRGLDYATKKTLIAAAGWNLLLLVKAMMRQELAKASILSAIRLVVALWSCLQWLWESIPWYKDRQPETYTEKLRLGLSWR